MKYYDNVNIEISGICNARCPYCITGIENTSSKIRGGVMSKDLFNDIYRHLIENNIIHSGTDIGLYNWGEPFLNRDLDEICSLLSAMDQPFHLSTNASVYKPLSVKNMKTIRTVILSMCGFSQKSYDRIHGFNFSTVIENIDKIVTDFRKVGCKKKFVIAYHIYQFNRGEMKQAYDFAKKLGIECVFSYAFLNGLSLGLDYMENTLSYDKLKQMGKDIDFGYLDELLSQKPTYEVCRELDRLVIDESGNVLMCCCTDRKCSNYSIGNIFDFKTFEDIYLKRNEIVKQDNICKKCMDYGLHYWMHNSSVEHISYDKRRLKG